MSLLGKPAGWAGLIDPMVPEILRLVVETWGEMQPPAPDQREDDITFLPTGKDLAPNESIYFCLECKRLNVLKNGRRRSYASEYVKFGMLRFVTGQYSLSVRHGGMVGYVLDGDVSRAMSNVENCIRKHRAKLRIVGPDAFVPSEHLKGVQSARESHHHRAHESTPFRIHHLFIAGMSPTGDAAVVAAKSVAKARTLAKHSRIRK